jgi:hypothetical protein
MARTAVVAGTATAVSNRVSRRQAGRWARQEEEHYGGQGYDQGYDQRNDQGYAAPPPAAPAATPPARNSMDDTLAQLKELGELRDRGLLSEAEFEGQKRKILG